MATLNEVLWVAFFGIWIGILIGICIGANIKKENDDD